MTFGSTAAQTDQPLVMGDAVLITAPALLVYTQPQAQGTMVGMLLRGTISRILKIQVADDGSSWFYLADNAYGWVTGTTSDTLTLSRYSDATLQTVIDNATAALSNNRNAIDAYHVRATAFASQHQNDKALADLNTAIGLAPKDAGLFEDRGRLHWQMHAYAHGAADVNQAISLGRKLPRTYNLLAVNYMSSGQYDQALKAFAQAVSLSPDFGLLYTNRAHIFSRQHDYGKAIQDHTQAIQRDPLLAIAYSDRGSAYANEAQDAKALVDFNQSLLIDPHCASCYVNRGIFRADHQNDEASALLDFNSAIENDAYIALAYVNRAVSYLHMGQSELGLADLKKAISLSPSDGFAQFTIAGVYAERGDFVDSIAAYTAAIQQGGSYGRSSYLFRGQVYVAAGQYDAAIRDLDTFMANVESSEFRAVGSLTRGAAHLYKHDYTAALLDYAATWADQNLVNFARDYHRQDGYRVTNGHEAQIEVLKQQISSHPKNTDLVYQLSMLYMEFGRWQEAVDSYKTYFTLVSQPVPTDLSKIFQTITS